MLQLLARFAGKNKDNTINILGVFKDQAISYKTATSSF